MTYKKGMNTSDKAKALKLIDAGRTAKEISDALRIELKVIEFLCPKPKPKPKAKPKKKAEVKDNGNLDE